MSDHGAATKVRWTMGEIVTGAWNTFASNWQPLVLAQLVLAACVVGPMIVCGISIGGLALISHGVHSDRALPAGIALSVGLTLVGIVVLLAMVGPAALRMVIAAARGQRPKLADLFSRPFQRAGALVVSSWLIGLATMVGMMLFIVPGIIFGLGAVMTHYVLIEDDQIGVVDSMRASRTLMRGHKAHYFFMTLLLIVVSLVAVVVLSVIPFMFPVVWAFDLFSTLFSWLLVATLYTRLRPLPAPLAIAEPVVAATA